MVQASGTISWMLEHSPAFAHMMQGIGDVSDGASTGEEKKQDEEKETSTEKQAESLENPKDNNVKTKSKRKEAGKGALIKKEHRATGSVSLAVVAAYGRAMGGILVLATVVLLYCTTEGVKIGSTYWVKFWASDAFNLLNTTEFSANVNNSNETRSAKLTQLQMLCTYPLRPSSQGFVICCCSHTCSACPNIRILRAADLAPKYDCLPCVRQCLSRHSTWKNYESILKRSKRY